MFSNQILPKICSKFYCENCDYGTSKKSNINNHYTTAKHMKSIVSNENKPKTSSNYICQICNKIYREAKYHSFFGDFLLLFDFFYPCLSSNFLNP